MRKETPSKLDAVADDLSQWLKPVPDGGEGLTLFAARARLQERGISVCPSRISDWWKARKAKLDWTALMERVRSGSQLGRDLAAEFEANPAPEIETLIKVLQVFVAQQASNRDDFDPDRIATLLRPIIDWAKRKDSREAFEFEKTKFAAAMKSKIESGLDALAEEFRQHPEALKLYERAKEIVNREA